MKKLQLLFLTIISLSSCKTPYDGLSGYWMLTYPDTSDYTNQVLHFTTRAGRLELVIDEPWDGSLGIPGENTVYLNDSLHFESLWGLFSYKVRIKEGESSVFGTRLLNDTLAVPFVMRKADEKELLYRIPRVDTDGERIYSYSYSVPEEKGDGLKCSSPEDAGIDREILSGMVKDVLSGKLKTIHSLLLFKDDKLVLEEYFHNYDAEILHSVESVTKSVTSALMGIAIDKGMVPGIDEPVWHYFEDWSTSRWVKQEYDIRIKHLLTMSAGIQWKAFTPDESNDDVDIYLAPDYIAYILNKEQVHEAGNQFYYNNRLMYLQGHIIEEASGMTVDSFATEYLFKELGVGRYVWKVYGNGITETGGGLKLLPRDMLKFGILYLDKGKWQDRQVLSSDWVAESERNQISTGSQGYGYNWWIRKFSFGDKRYDMIYALGHGEQCIVVLPDLNAVFVMTAGNYFSAPQKLDEIMLTYIFPALCNSKEKSGNILVIKKEDCVGEYEINQEESILIELKDGILYAVDPSGEWMKLTEKGSGYFSVDNSPREVKIILDEENRVMAAEVIVNGEVVEKLKKIR